MPGAALVVGSTTTTTEAGGRGAVLLARVDCSLLPFPLWLSLSAPIPPPFPRRVCAPRSPLSVPVLNANNTVCFRLQNSYAVLTVLRTRYCAVIIEPDNPYVLLLRLALMLLLGSAPVAGVAMAVEAVAVAAAVAAATVIVIPEAALRPATAVSASSATAMAATPEAAHVLAVRQARGATMTWATAAATALVVAGAVEMIGTAGAAT